MIRSRSLLGALLRIALITTFVAGLIFVIGQILSFPAQAEALFGRADATLPFTDKLQLTYKLVNEQEKILTPTNPAGDNFSFSIEPGEGVSSITQRLEAYLLIHSAVTLNDYLIYKGLDTRIQAGTYTLSPAMTAVEIAQTLLDNSQAAVPFVILPGWRLEEVAAALPTSGLNISEADFLTAANSRPMGFAFLSELPLGVSLEGFLSPGTYTVPRDANANSLLSLFLANFEAQLTPKLLAGFEAEGLTLHQAVILASIVEREALVDDEKPIIVSVYINRLRIQMQLAADPTVQYALGYNTAQGAWWTNPLSLDDLKFDSAYNTYIYAGLPPTPIANPTLSSLEAVASPAETPYYFFRAACDNSGRHSFSVTYDEHLGNACE